jgi:hypothetical protein
MDTMNWVPISGIFTSNGTEKFITIGNFYTNANTDTITIPWGTAFPSDYAAYLIDDVSVIDISDPDFAGNDTVVGPGCPVLLGHPDDIGFTSEWTLLGDTSILSKHGDLLVSDTITKTYVVKMVTTCVTLFDTITVTRDSTLKCIYAGVHDWTNVETGFKVYPNPTTGIIKINLPAHQNYSLKFINELGQTIDFIKSPTTEQTYTITNYEGLLIIQLINNFGTIIANKKIVVDGK